MMKNILMALPILLLTACGGGSGGSGGSNQSAPSTPIAQNSAPTITVDKTNIDMFEGTSLTLDLNYSDPDGDTLTVSVKAQNPLTASVSGKSLQINAGNVSQDVTSSVVVSVSDGEKSASITLTVNISAVVESSNRAPVISMNETEFTVINGDDLEFITYSIVDPDGDPVIFDTLKYEHSNGLEVTPFNGYFDIKALDVGRQSVTFSMEDSLGLRSEAMTFIVNVNKEEVDENIHAPELYFPNGSSIDAYSEETVYLLFNSSDKDPKSNLRCQFDYIDSENIPRGFEYYVDCENQQISFSSKEIKNTGWLRFNFSVNDGKFSSQEESVIVRFIGGDSNNAKIELNYEKPYIKMLKNDTRTVSYTITGDDAEQVTFEGVEDWYGETIEMTVSHVPGEFTFTSSMLSNYGEKYGYIFRFMNGDRPITVFAEVKITSDPNTEENLAAAEMKKRYTNALTQTREFNILGKLYADYLFNVGKISFREKESYDATFDADNRDIYGTVQVYVRQIQQDIESNKFHEDDTLLKKYSDLFNGQFITVMTVSGRNTTPLVNELAQRDEALFTVEFNEWFNWLDEDELNSSKFIGDTQYGSYENGMWVYRDEYRLLRAISNKTNHAEIVK
jgi:hypothetical protein